MKNNLIGPSTALLPMEDIADELLSIYNVASKDDTLKDTENVSGVPAKFIARAALNAEGNALLKNRDTVLNALNLGDIPANQYVQEKDIVKIDYIAKNINNILSAEVLNLRDEVYQIKDVLAKRGFIKNNNNYEGFADSFLNNDIKYIYNQIEKTKAIANVANTLVGTNISTFQVTAPAEFNVGDWIVIYKPADKLYYPREITDLNIQNKTITINESVSNLDIDTEIYKTFGDYYKDSFSFSSIIKNITDDNKIFTTQVNDSELEDFNITSENTGYATEIKIPADSKGCINSLTIKGRSHGNPGDLQCFIIDEEYINNFTNYAKALTDNQIIGVSEYIHAIDHPIDSDITFNFTVPNSSGDKPILLDKKYVFVIKSLNANTYGDFWSIKMSDINNTSTNINYYKTYNFKEIPYGSVKVDIPFTLGNNIDSHSLYFRLITNPIKIEDEDPHQTGLYTATIDLPNPIKVSKARLTLRINKEGGYYVTNPPGSYTTKTTLNFKNDPTISSYGNAKYGSGFLKDETVIIGNNIIQIENSNNNSVDTKTGLYLDNNSPIYRVGIKARIRASYQHFNEQFEKETEITNTNEKGQEIPYNFDLISIMPDGKSKEYLSASDRLIFEKEFNKDEDGIPQYVNHFELQIKYDSNFNDAALKEFRELVGRLYSLNLSFQQTL